MNIESTQYLVVLSTNPKLSKIVVTIDGEDVETITVDTVPSLSVFALPSEDFNLEYNFYDESNNRIQ